MQEASEPAGGRDEEVIGTLFNLHMQVIIQSSIIKKWITVKMNEFIIEPRLIQLPQDTLKRIQV